MLIVEFKLCGFGITNNHEYGDPKNIRIKRYNLGLVSILRVPSKGSKVWDYISAYAWNGAAALPQFQEDIQRFKENFEKNHAMDVKSENKRLKELNEILQGKVDDLQSKQVGFKNLAYQVRNVVNMEEIDIEKLTS